ncbi:molecular chaperone DnaJ [Patescibacteria group bacterium]
MPKNFYETLGVERGASDQDIKRAYRKKAQKYHPDKNKGDKAAETKFKEINEAYETLSDRKKRSFYDQFGQTQGAAGPGGAQGFGGFNAQGFDFSNMGGGFADIFETFFSGSAGGARSRTSRGGPVRGEDIQAQIRIKFEESVTGTDRELEITKAEKCEHCKAKGAEPGSKIITCPVCSGTGEIKEVRQTLLGQIATSRTCDTCRGEGTTPEKKCSVCHGTTRTRKKEKVKVKIPAGINDDSTIRLSGKGEAGVKGGRYGDLYLHINIEPHREFVRSGDDIHTDQKIHLIQGVLGDEIEIPTVYEKIKLKIPSGTQSGKVFKIKGYGMPRLNTEQKGDHYLKIILDVPAKLSKKEKELYAQLANEAELDIKEGKKGLFG